MFGTAATVIALVLIAYATIVEPVLGWFEYRRLVARRDSDPRALVRVYRFVVVSQWGWTILVLIAVALSPALDLAGIGLRVPVADGFVLAASASAAIALVFSAVSTRRATRAGRPVPGQAAFEALLPRTREERRYAVAGAITAGVCEELLYRAFFIAVGVQLFHLSPTAAAVASVVIFAVAHVYQGWRGMLAVTLLAVLLTILYVRSASLLLPVILHVLVDLRALLLLEPSPAGAGGE